MTQQTFMSFKSQLLVFSLLLSLLPISIFSFFEVSNNHLVRILALYFLLVTAIFLFLYFFLYHSVLKNLNILTRFTQGVDLAKGTCVQAPPQMEKHVPKEIGSLTDSVIDMANGALSELAKRKAAEEELRNSEYRYRIIFENNPLAVIRMDHEGTIIDCNNKFIDLMGSDREKIIGFNGARNSTPKMRPVIRKALNGEEAIFEDEYTSVTGGKTVFLRAVYNPVHPGQSPTAIIATLEDISVRKRAEEAIRNASERMNAIFSSIKDPILVHPYTPSGHGLFSEVNDVACTRYGYTRDEFLQLSVKDIIKQEPGGQEIAIERLERIVKSGHMVFETVHVTRSGEAFPVEVSVSVMEQAGERAILAVVRDISERHFALLEKSRLESQLQQSQKIESVGRLAGGVAHDFNNMLSVILGYSDLALSQVTPEHPLYKNLTEIKKAAKHSAELTGQLLAFARKQTIAPMVLDLNEAINKMSGMLHRLIGEEIVVDLHPTENIWPIRFDPSQINQILANLIINARDAIPGKGKITISTENVTLLQDDCTHIIDSRPGEYVVLSISDDGHGIEEEKLEYIFEPFFTTKTQGEGTGLGLATVYGIIKQNQGFISVMSAPGQGTTFKNYLPRFQGSVKIQSVIEPDRDFSPNGGKHTILLVEDEPAILEVASVILRQQGYKIIATAAPEEALRIAQHSNEKIDLLITDVIMPKMNGKELAERLLEIFPNLQCLFMSGYTADVIAQHGVLEDGIHFIQKPFTHDEVMAALSTIFTLN